MDFLQSIKLRHLGKILRIQIIQNIWKLRIAILCKHSLLNFTKTPLANLLIYYFQQIRVSIPGRVPPRSSQFFQASRYRQFVHTASVHDDDKDRGTFAKIEPQTL